MVRPGRERLSGRVEVLGGAEEGLRGRQTQKKALVAIAAEEDGAGIGRIRMKRIRGASKQQLHGFIQEAVEPDSTIHTDGWEGYVGLEALGYRHEYGPVRARRPPLERQVYVATSLFCRPYHRFVATWNSR